MRFTASIIRQGKYDLILAVCSRANVLDVLDVLLAYYLSRRYKIALVFNIDYPLPPAGEVLEIEQRKPKILYYLILKLAQSIITPIARRADLILSVSKWLTEYLVGQGFQEGRIMSLPTGIEIGAYLRQEGGEITARYSLSGSKVIIYVGTLAKARCLNLLLNAFSEVTQERGKVKLLMVGDGSDKEGLQRLAAGLGIEHDVIFTGQVPQSEVPGFIAASDIGVSPVAPLSIYKMSSPIKMLEYMGMAKPVVANEEILDQKEVLEQSGGGILVPFTPEGFANAVIELLDNPAKAAEMGQKGREWVVKNRSFEILARQVEARYLKLLAPIN
jgi:glycosyltransferase involved in cell wall biosynthesis